MLWAVLHPERRRAPRQCIESSNATSPRPGESLLRDPQVARSIDVETSKIIAAAAVRGSTPSGSGTSDFAGTTAVLAGLVAAATGFPAGDSIASFSSHHPPMLKRTPSITYTPSPSDFVTRGWVGRP